jgi:restriction system protein
MNDEKTVWGVHAGIGGEADDTFLKNNVIAMGWSEVPDVATLLDAKEGIKKAIRSAKPKATTNSVANLAGQLYRFFTEVQPGDVVVYPSKVDKHIHIGQVLGPYFFDVASVGHYPHRRRVEWKKKVPRTDFSQGALYETGAFMTLFQVKTYGQEFVAALERSAGVELTPPTEDPSIDGIGEITAENTEDFVRKILSRQMKGHPLADFVGHLLTLMGYRTEVSKPGTDEGVDIVAYRDELGFEPPIIRVQVKSSDDSVGSPQVHQLQGTLAAGECGLFVTLGTFSSAARTYVKGHPGLKLIDGDQFIDLVLAHYEDLSPYYKTLIPLKRVYVPQSRQSESEDAEA